MKRYRFLGRVLAILTVTALLLSMLNVAVFAKTGTWDQNFLIEQAVAVNGAPVSAIEDSIEYAILQGDFFGGGVLNRFTTFGTTAPMMLGSEVQPVCIWPWQIKATAGTDAVFRFTAKQDLYMKLWQDAPTTTDWVENMQITYVVENSAGTRVTLKTLTTAVGQTISTADYDTQLHLAAGDTAYVIYRMAAGTGTYASNMRVTVDTAAYDAQLRVDFTQEPDVPQECSHIYNRQVIKAATPLANGTACCTCSLCGDSYEEDIPATDTLKVLTIGNSCTDNSSYYLWQHLDALCTAADVDVQNITVANAQIGGTSLDDHWNQIESGASEYTYRKTTDGNWVYSSQTVSLHTALADEDWDIITVNSRLGYSGMPDRFASLDKVLHWLNGNKTNQNAAILYLMPWACPADSTYPDFPSYGNDQLAMYAAIADVTENMVAVNSGIAKILPVGTAIQNARTSYAGDEFDYDGIHLNTLGMYIAAMTVAGAILETELTAITWAPEGIPEDCVALAKESAANAIDSPYAITPSQMTDVMELPDRVTQLRHSDMVSKAVYSRGEQVAAAGITYQYLYGDLQKGTLYPFSTFSGDGSGEANDVVGNENGDNAIWRWQWRANDTCATVLRITAAEDVKLMLSHPDAIPEGDIWAFHSTFTLYTANGAGDLVKLADYPVQKPMDTAAVSAIVHMAAGDSIYLVYGVNAGSAGQVTAGLMPCFTVNQGGYDASLRTDFAGESGQKPEAPSDYLEHPDMVSAQVAAKGSAVSRELIEFQYLTGNFYKGKLSAFTAFSGSGKGEANDILGGENTANAVWRWQWRCGSKQTVLRMTAKENAAITLSALDVDQQQWAEGSAYYVIAENAKGAQALLKTVAVTANMEAAAGFLTVHLAKGEKLYIVYGNSYGSYDNTSPATSGFIPAFSIDTAAYNSAKAPAYSGKVSAPAGGTSTGNAGTDSSGGGGSNTTELTANGEIYESDLVSEEVLLQGGVISKGLADFQYLTGDFFGGGELLPFTEFSGSGNYEASDVVGNANGTNFAFRWQWRGTATNNTILKITAKKDIRLSVEQRDPITDEQWATHSSFAYVTENGQQERLIVRQMEVKAQMDSEYIQTEVHLAAGDSLYIVYYIHTGVDGHATAHYFPCFVLDTAGYDPSLRTDYSLITALLDAKEEKTAALQALLAQMLGDGSVYSESNAAQLEQIVSDAISGFDRLSTVEAVIAAYEDAVQQMVGVQTLADVAAELADYKVRAKAELAEFVQEKDYSKENWQQIQQIIAQANSDIDAAKNAAGVSQVLAYAKANIRKIEVKETPSLPVILLIGGSILLVGAAVLMVCQMRRKKKKQA